MASARERRAVFGLHAAVAAAIWVTHARTPPERLYHTHRGGLSRVLVFSNYPTAVAAIATLPLARRRGRWAALPLCLVAVVPGVVDEADLDGHPRNLPAAAGVLLAAAAGTADALPRRRGGARAARIALAAGLACVSVPWMLALAGVQTRGMRQPSPGEPGVDRVHLGHHDGLDGALLAWDALILARRRTARPHRWLLALLLSYGVWVAAADAWLEQVVKRGWARRRLPDVRRPAPTAAWAVLLATTPLTRRLIH